MVKEQDPALSLTEPRLQIDSQIARIDDPLKEKLQRAVAAPEIAHFFNLRAIRKGDLEKILNWVFPAEEYGGRLALNMLVRIMYHHKPWIVTPNRGLRWGSGQIAEYTPMQTVAILAVCFTYAEKEKLGRERYQLWEEVRRDTIAKLGEAQILVDILKNQNSEDSPKEPPLNIEKALELLAKVTKPTMVQWLKMMELQQLRYESVSLRKLRPSEEFGQTTVWMAALAIVAIGKKLEPSLEDGKMILEISDVTYELLMRSIKAILKLEKGGENLTLANVINLFADGPTILKRIIEARVPGGPNF